MLLYWCMRVNNRRMLLLDPPNLTSRLQNLEFGSKAILGEVYVATFFEVQKVRCSLTHLCFSGTMLLV